jgi:rhamnose transport system permease protein
MLRTLVQRGARWESFLVVLLVSTLVIGAEGSSAFLTASNQSIAAAAFAERAVMVLPLTLIIVMGDIDLSIASVVTLSSAIFGLTVEAGIPVGVCIVLTLLMGAAAGAFNGLLVVKVGLPSLVVTLGTLTLYAGLAQGVLGERQITAFPSFVTDFGYNNLPCTGIPWPVAVFVVLAVPFAIVLHASRLGREIYAVGSNAEAARFSGVRSGRLRFFLFVTSGTLAGLAGMMLTARLSTSSAANGGSFLLDAIAVVLLGGVSIFGGKGTLVGVLLSLVLMLELQNGLSLSNVSTNAQQVVIGGLLIFSVLVMNGLGYLRAARRARRAHLERPSLHGLVGSAHAAGSRHPFATPTTSEGER